MLIILLFIPLLAAILLAITGSRAISAYLSVVASFIAFVVAIVLLVQLLQQHTLFAWRQWLYLDYFNGYFIILTTFISFTIAIFNIAYLKEELNQQKLTKKSLRFFHSIYQFFMFAMLLALISNNLGILWVAMEGATLATVLLVSLYRTPASLEAAWKYLILCGVGIAQALLGTILLYFAAEKILGPNHSLLWTQLQLVSGQLSPTLVSLAFIFLFVGYGTKAGLVPLHNWLPDAYGEAPASVSALLSGLLLNVALYAILRCKVILDGATHSQLGNHLLLGFGLLNVIVAAAFLLRQKEIKRLFAYSSIEHVGLICVAFGLNTPLAMIAGLLHMAVHSLSKTAAFFAAGQTIQRRGTQIMADIKGLLKDSPWLGWGFLLAVFVIIGMPPFAVFTSEFLIIYSMVQQQILLLPLWLFGLLLGFAATIYKTQAMLFANTEPMKKTVAVNYLPLYLHLLLLFLLGLSLPLFLMGWFNHIGQILQRLLP